MLFHKRHIAVDIMGNLLVVVVYRVCRIAATVHGKIFNNLGTCHWKVVTNMNGKLLLNMLYLKSITLSAAHRAGETRSLNLFER